MEYKIISGIPREDIKGFFLSQSISWDGEKTFYGEGWKVEVGQQILKTRGIISIPQTDIIFTLANQDAFNIVDKFRLKFLSAGG